MTRADLWPGTAEPGAKVRHRGGGLQFNLSKSLPAQCPAASEGTWHPIFFQQGSHVTWTSVIDGYTILETLIHREVLYC